MTFTRLTLGYWQYHEPKQWHHKHCECIVSRRKDPSVDLDLHLHLQHLALWNIAQTIHKN